MLSQSRNIIDDILQQSLQTLQIALRDVQQGLIPVIPVGESQKQANGCQHRQRDGKYNLKEDSELASAIDFGRLNQGIRNGLLEEGTADDDVEGSYQQGENQGPNGVAQPQQVAGDKVSSYQAAVKHHGNHNNPGQYILQFVIGTAHDITHQSGKQGAQHRAKKQRKKGYEFLPECYLKPLYIAGFKKEFYKIKLNHFIWKFINSIFNVKNFYKENKKHKLITILGFDYIVPCKK